MEPVDLAVGAFAVHRLTRLVTEDSITEPLRRPVIQERPDSRLADFLTCPWCVSVHAAALMYLTRNLPGWRAVATILAWSTVTGTLAERT